MLQEMERNSVQPQERVGHKNMRWSLKTMLLLIAVFAFLIVGYQVLTNTRPAKTVSEQIDNINSELEQLDGLHPWAGVYKSRGKYFWLSPN